jgi:CRP-like cAMP-binding protein
VSAAAPLRHDHPPSCTLVHPRARSPAVCDPRRRIVLCTKRKELYGKQIRMKPHEIEEQFISLDDGNTGAISFNAFEGWFANLLKSDIRAARRMARQLFDLADEDKSDSLTKKELGVLFEQMMKRFPQIELVPPFNLDDDFEKMAKSLLNMSVSNAKSFVTEQRASNARERLSASDVFSEDVGFGRKTVVCWDAFEFWWRQRTGDMHGAAPVLPESMVTRIDELSEGTGRSLASSIDGIKRGKKFPGGTHHPENSRERWKFLHSRIVQMSHATAHLWGRLGDLYPGATTGKVAGEIQLIEHRYMRHPNSNFVRVTDIISVIAILYTVIVVPFRICFNYFPDAGTWAFWLDVGVDLVFCVDIVLNFRTAKITDLGVLEQDPKVLSVQYLRGWFVPDFFSAIPFNLVAYVLDSEANSDAGIAVKAIRLTRLMKMMRATRIVKVLSRFDNFDEWRMRMSSFLTFAVIAYAAHILACIWYILGASSELGWVQRLLWTSSDQCPQCPDVSMANRYAHAMYTVLKLGDSFAVAGSEKAFAVFAEGASILIQAALAGLMSQLMFASKVGENAYLIKLAQLKAWMASRRFSADRQRRIMKHFVAKNQSATHFDEKQVLSTLPEALARDLSLEMYKPILVRSPLFRHLSKEIVLELCAAIISTTTVTGHVIFKRGDVGHEMYFVINGEVEVTAGENCELLGHLTRGGFFGEKAVVDSVGQGFYGIGNAVRIRTVRATTNTELGVLRAQDILRLCSRYPELQIRMKSFARCGLRAVEASSKRAVESWSCDTLCEWLSAEMDLKDVAAAAQEQAVDGELALEMDSMMWRELGAKGLEPARIARAIKKRAK